MPDIHVPKLDEHGSGKSIFKLVLEVALIGIGVFLGLAGEQWRERAHQRELAEQALRRFRTEIVENRQAVADVKDYHAAVRKRLHAEFDKPPNKRSADNFQMSGIRPVNFDHSAWDLTIATQSLSYIDAGLSLALSRVYNTQETMSGLARGLTQAMYVTPPIDEARGTTFFAAVMLFYDDMEVYEPGVLKLYDDILPKIENALGEKSH